MSEGPVSVMSVEQATPWEGAILLIFCALMALGGLGILVWAAVAGILLSLDGMLLAAVCLLAVLLFGGNVVWAFHTGEAQMIAKALFKSSGSQKEQA
ncbi:MAG TPA: hypothetical protein VFD30_17270 [Terriglobia bacterium]|jgi:hypothetical protein|nr:hypothetical protein [Terriglobia bacterium]